MPKITPTDSSTLIKVFERLGFRRARTKGGHLSMTKAGIPRPVVIPLHGEIQPTIILSNLRTAGISREEYFKILADL